MDRRQVALGIAVAASVATSYGPPPALFYGEESLNAAPVVLDEIDPIRAWVITTEVTLPTEATRQFFNSTTKVEASTAAQDWDWEDSAGEFVVVASECGNEGVADGPARAGSVEIKDSFVDCVPEQTCTRTFCVAIGNGSDHQVDVEWSTSTIIESQATVGYTVDSITVPIDIDIDEILP